MCMCVCGIAMKRHPIDRSIVLLQKEAKPKLFAVLFLHSR